MIHSYCAACGDTGNLYQHHLIPRALGGSDDPVNLITLCGTCHGKAHGVKSVWHTRALTSAALQHKRLKNERVGSIPYGYDLAPDGIKLIKNAEEQAVIVEAKQLRTAGLSLDKVAAELDKRGVRARNGRPFKSIQILRMVANA